MMFLAAAMMTILCRVAISSPPTVYTVHLNISLLECVQGIPGISHYLEHCDSAGLQNMLKDGSNGHTMIAATNEGFADEAKQLEKLGRYERIRYMRDTILEGEYTTQALAGYFAFGGKGRALRSAAGHPITCHAYEQGVYTVNGGRVIKQYVLADGVLIIVDKFYHEYDEPLLVGLHVSIDNNDQAFILEKTIDKLKLNGYDLDDCTFATPPQAVISHLQQKPELLLHYVFAKRYYPIDYKYLASVTSYAGIVYNVDYNCNSNVRIGKHAVCDLECRVSNEGVAYPAKKSSPVDQIDLRSLGLNLNAQLAILNH